VASAAAAVALMAGGEALVAHLRAPPAPAAPPTPQAREYTTRRGQTARVRLSDGSRVTLAPESRLRVPLAFGDGTRALELDGEAAFDVAHDAKRSFSVRARGAEVRDLGTKFVVRSYGDRSSVYVAVTEGSVSLAAALDADGNPASGNTGGVDRLLLKRAQVGRLADDGRLTVIRDAALDDYVAWTSDRLTFTNAPLRDVLPRLNRWYDIDLRLGDTTLAAVPYTASLSQEPVETVVQLLAAAVGARVERRGATITLRRLDGTP